MAIIISTAVTPPYAFTCGSTKTPNVAPTLAEAAAKPPADARILVGNNSGARAKVVALGPAFMARLNKMNPANTSHMCAAAPPPANSADTRISMPRVMPTNPMTCIWIRPKRGTAHNPTRNPKRRKRSMAALPLASVNSAAKGPAVLDEEWIAPRITGVNAGYVAASFRVLSLGNTASQVVQLVSKIVTAGILYFGAKLVIEGSLSVGELVAFNILAGRVSAPVLRLAQIWQDFHQARLSIARLGDILNTTAEPTYTPGRARLPAIRGNIKFDHVSFRYRIDGPEVLHDVSFDVPAGQTVGIVGPSGSGKSTFAKLVQRLYVPERGRVLVDGMDLAMVDAAWLRRQIGVVLQENMLFNRSVRDNIALADPAMPMERVIAAARLAGAHEFILELEEGYDTMVGERGSTLSGGQRQRIAIARALVTDPRILIFDEATSALDYESERIIQQNMKEIARGRTVLIIAHRLSAVRAADR